MCGIFGVVSWSRPVDEARLSAAHAVQGHRGPDGSGTWRGRVGRCDVALGHGRLSIIDLSDAASQPMVDAARGTVLSYNGELYNYLEMRAELAGAGEGFRTSSDTEVLQTALSRWGVGPALTRANGMWAFAWLDERAQRLVLSRDRAGEKPLYMCWDGDTLFFASEIKTLFALTGGRRAVDAQVAGEYLLQAAVDTGERTFFEGIRKLPAATFAAFDLSAPASPAEPVAYWRCAETTPARGLDDLIEETRETFLDSVRIRLRSDVPVGVLLSGGIDSSAIAAAVQAIRGKDARLDMLSAVSADPRFDESRFIDLVARHLGRAPRTVSLDLVPRDALAMLSDVTWYNDEPVVSFTSVAHHMLMRKAGELGLKVVLSGQGADEILCGYRKYVGFAAQALLRERRPLAAAQLLYGFWRNGSMLNQFNLAEGRRYLPGRRKSAGIAGPALADYVPVSLGLGDGSVQRRQVADITRFSVPALCHYEDRMSMANGREIRLPFLDHRLVDLLVPAPVDAKLHKGWTKYVFRRAMDGLLPREIAWRKDKQGFVSPQGEWLKNELRGAVLEHFGSDALMVKAGLVDHRQLQARYEAYCRQPAGAGDIWFRDLFAPLALEVWMRRFAEHLQC
jgi:asparagine synthase (glutamine-hydrolysing)